MNELIEQLPVQCPRCGGADGGHRVGCVWQGPNKFAAGKLRQLIGEEFGTLIPKWKLMELADKLER